MPHNTPPAPPEHGTRPDKDALPQNTHRRQRPQRLSLCGEDGRRLSLAEGLDAFVRLDSARDARNNSGSRGNDKGNDEGNDKGSKDDTSPALVLGLGADAGAALAASVLKGCTDVLWMECPDFALGMEEHAPKWLEKIPGTWQKLLPEGAPLATLAARAALAGKGRRIYWHKQNLRLFPSFWPSVLGAVQAALLGVLKPVAPGAGGTYHSHTVLLAGSGADLLHRELAAAFAAEGFTVSPLLSLTQEGKDKGNQQGHTNTAHSLHKTLRAQMNDERPALFFSVNGRGLDAEGVNFALLKACGVPVALWLVDNPWHILSAWRQGWWREAHIFVTDHSFIPALQQAGASHVHHLPLAVAQHMAAARTTSAHVSTLTSMPPALIHFVGRASFPARDKFFAASRVAEKDMEDAQTLLNTVDDGGPLPDFHWWTQRMQVTLWPGYAVRAAGLGAERCAALRRTQWLRACLPLGLAVHGDGDGWRTRLPDAPEQVFQPAVDYYGALPSIYAHAYYSLNVTSLLLPAGLTQRHFDVWAAGGFLLTAATQGLCIFPPELTQEITLSSPRCLPETVARLERSPQLRRHLQEAWQEHLNANHTYAHRVRAVLTTLDPAFGVGPSLV